MRFRAASRLGLGRYSRHDSPDLFRATHLSAGLHRDMGFHENFLKYINTDWLSMALFAFLILKKPIVGKIFVALGSITYSVYPFGPVVQAALAQVLAGHEVFIPIHVFVMATALGSIAIAAVVFRLVEVPSIDLGRRIMSPGSESSRAGLSAASGSQQLVSRSAGAMKYGCSLVCGLQMYSRA